MQRTGASSVCRLTLYPAPVSLATFSSILASGQPTCTNSTFADFYMSVVLPGVGLWQLNRTVSSVICAGARVMTCMSQYATMTACMPAERAGNLPSPFPPLAAASDWRHGLHCLLAL